MIYKKYLPPVELWTILATNNRQSSAECSAWDGLYRFRTLFLWWLWCLPFTLFLSLSLSFYLDKFALSALPDLHTEGLEKPIFFSATAQANIPFAPIFAQCTLKKKPNTLTVMHHPTQPTRRQWAVTRADSETRGIMSYYCVIAVYLSAMSA